MALIPIIPGLIRDVCGVIWDQMDGLGWYRMSMVSMEWNVYSEIRTCCIKTHEQLFIAIEKRDVLSVLKYYHVNTDNIMYYVCKYGNSEFVSILHKKYEYTHNSGLYAACDGGNTEIIEYMIKKGATDIYHGFNCACASGKIDAVQFLISKGVINWGGGFLGACESGHIDIAKLLINKVTPFTNWSYYLNAACSGGNIEIMQLLIERGANDCHCGRTMSQHLK